MICLSVVESEQKELGDDAHLQCRGIENHTDLEFKKRKRIFEEEGDEEQNISKTTGKRFSACMYIQMKPMRHC